MVGKNRNFNKRGVGLWGGGRVEKNQNLISEGGGLFDTVE